MKNQIVQEGQIKDLIAELNSKPILNEESNLVYLSSNELANILLKISNDISNESSIDKVLENSLKLIGEAAIAETILLFQINEEENIASVTHCWTSPYINNFNPIGVELKIKEVPLVKLIPRQSKHTLQIENLEKYFSLPNYIFSNKYKAPLMNLKTKSFLLTVGTSNKTKLALNLHVSTRNVVWSNEVEKLLEAVVNQLAIAIEKNISKLNKENLQKNIINIQQKAIKEKEDLIRQFASDVHDLPCSFIPGLKDAIKRRDFDECEKLVDDLYITLRQLINEYVVPDQELLGFGSSIYQFINGFKKSFKGKIATELPEEEINLSNRQKTEIFKVVKEWFCNIEKHSYASEVYFKVTKVNDLYYVLSVKDNGIGFDVDNEKNFGYGLLNIRRRLKDINAKFEIKSRVKKGSILRIQIMPEYLPI